MKNFKNEYFKLNRAKVVLIGIAISIPRILTTFMYGGIGKGQLDNETNPMMTHIHPELSITTDDKPLTIPAGIGIISSLWNNHTLDIYGMQEMPEMSMSGMAPLHTHDDSGTIHLETSVNRNYTLDEFFEIWGLDIDEKTVNASVNDIPVADYNSIILEDGQKIVLEIRSN